MRTIAHIGWTKTVSDFERAAEVFDWVTANSSAPKKSDFIDLSKGRDFFTEDKRYDVVVLHFIFRGGFGYNGKSKELATSPLAGWSQWRKKLIATGATYIFAYGGLAEVGGTYLAHLDGYMTHRVRTEDQSLLNNRVSQLNGLWIFEKS